MNTSTSAPFAPESSESRSPAAFFLCELARTAQRIIYRAGEAKGEQDPAQGEKILRQHGEVKKRRSYLQSDRSQGGKGAGREVGEV